MDFEREREVNKREKCKARKMHPVPEILVLKIIIKKGIQCVQIKELATGELWNPKEHLKREGKWRRLMGRSFRAALFTGERDATEGRRGQTGWREEEEEGLKHERCVKKGGKMRVIHTF